MRANFIPAVLLAILTFTAFRWCYLRCSSAPVRLSLIVLGFGAAVPAVWFASNYAIDIPYAAWFYEFHTLPGAEITTGFVTALLGVIYASAKLRTAKLNIAILAVCTLIAALLLVTPFAKQLLRNVDYGSLDDKWKDGVCIQSTGYTCVPACTATYLRLKGHHVTEAELARAAGTTRTGTEYWYLARALRKRGYTPVVRRIRSMHAATVPSIVGVKLGDIGHVVVLLARDKKGVTIAEPLRGQRHYSWRTFDKCYETDGTCVTIGYP